MLNPRRWPGSGWGGQQPVEVGCGATATAHGFLQFLRERAASPQGPLGCGRRTTALLEGWRARGASRQ